ncbi:MAG: DUF1552 domain-containing protein [Fimbriiglobus sp.]|nr:DUF1552 domain-containing protein [Fimbriiglobus sp.]
MSNGVNILDWIPKDAGDKYSLSPTLETLKDHRYDITVSPASATRTAAVGTEGPTLG